jgi:retinol dehydrogenase 12
MEMVVIPWGRIQPLREDLVKAGTHESEGGTGNGLKFWDWCEEQVSSYLL